MNNTDSARITATAALCGRAIMVGEARAKRRRAARQALRAFKTRLRSSAQPLRPPAVPLRQLCGARTRTPAIIWGLFESCVEPCHKTPRREVNPGAWLSESLPARLCGWLYQPMFPRSAASSREGEPGDEGVQARGCACSREASAPLRKSPHAGGGTMERWGWLVCRDFFGWAGGGFPGVETGCTNGKCTRHQRCCLSLFLSPVPCENHRQKSTIPSKYNA